MDAEGDELKRLLQELKDSPGYKIHAEMAGVRTGLEAVRKNRDELIQAIVALRKEYVGEPSVDAGSATAGHALEEVARRLENYLWSAYGLFDHIRRRSQEKYGRIGIGREIQSELDKHFVYAADHRLASGLRDVGTHAELLQPPPNFRAGKDAAYKLPVGQLLAWSGWHDDQRKLLESMTKDFDVEEFANRYFAEVEDFCGWLLKKQTDAHSAELALAEEVRVRAKEQYDKVFPPSP